MVGTISRIGNYVIVETLGKGGFAKVYKCKDEQNQKEFAIKVETVELNNGTRQCFEKPPSGTYYAKEWDTYKALQFGATKESKEGGIPRIYERGIVRFDQRDSVTFHPFLVMQLFGKNIAQLTIREGVIKGIPVPEFQSLAIQIVNSLKYLHKKKIIHRDLKPQNFCNGQPGTADEQKVFIIDMGFSQEAPVNKLKVTDTFVGTPDYSSINSMKGVRQSYKDDMEAICYTFVELWLGDLPWNVQAEISYESDGWSKDQLFDMAIRRQKNWNILQTLELLPKPFFDWVKYCQTLDLLDEPDYSYFLYLIQQCSNCHQYTFLEVTRKLQAMTPFELSQASQFNSQFTSQMTSQFQSQQESTLEPEDLALKQVLNNNFNINKKRQLSCKDKDGKMSFNKKYQVLVEE